MLNEEDKKALNEYGNRRFFWKGRIARYVNVGLSQELCKFHSRHLNSTVKFNHKMGHS